MATDWHEQRHLLRPGDVFMTREGELVRLDRPVSDDAAKWHVESWSHHGWARIGETIEPSGLLGRDEDPDPASAIADNVSADPAGTGEGKDVERGIRAAVEQALAHERADAERRTKEAVQKALDAERRFLTNELNRAGNVYNGMYNDLAGLCYDLAEKMSARVGLRTPKA